MEKIIIRKATIEDLVSIQELNNSLFELEYENFDDTLQVLIHNGGHINSESGYDTFEDIVSFI